MLTIVELLCLADETDGKEQHATKGWHVRCEPQSHPVNRMAIDVLVGADGRRNTLSGFDRKEFRGRLAIAITCNFVNRHSREESSVPEISGVSRIFKQQFFQQLFEEIGIDLENIVYYKDDTHYFVMTASKTSLLAKGVLKQVRAIVYFPKSGLNVGLRAVYLHAKHASKHHRLSCARRHVDIIYITKESELASLRRND